MNNPPDTTTPTSTKDNGRTPSGKSTPPSKPRSGSGSGSGDGSGSDVPR